MEIGKWIQILSKNVHKISCMGYELVLELGQKVGQLISKSEEKLWDIDIENFTVSPLDQIKCMPGASSIRPQLTRPSARLRCTFD